MDSRQCGILTVDADIMQVAWMLDPLNFNTIDCFYSNFYSARSAQHMFAIASENKGLKM